MNIVIEPFLHNYFSKCGFCVVKDEGGIGNPNPSHKGITKYVDGELTLPKELASGGILKK